jgi:DNA repair exonuclease SbcCD nuclease subunit
MFRFLHAADLHLDSPLRGLDRYENAPVEAIRGASRRALENLVGLAIERRVDFVLLAGDLYDGDWRDHNTGLHLAHLMSRLREAHIHVFVIQGNHDAASKLTKVLRMPENVHGFSVERPERHVMDGLDVAIHGQGFASSEVTEDLSSAYPARVPGLFNIGLLHTCASGREGHEPYAPCTLDGLRSKHYQYWALGHIHKRERLHDDPPIHFPGNIQGRHIRETGAKGCLLVTVDDSGRVETEFCPLDVVRWERCRVEADGAADGEEMLERLASQMESMLPACGDRVLGLRVEFVGRCRAHDRVAADPERWTNEVRAVATERSGGRAWVEKVKFLTRPIGSPWEEHSDGPIGELVRLFAELRHDPARLHELAQRELADLRKKLPADVLEAADGLRLDDPERLRELLDQVQPVLLDRLLA